LALAQHRIPLHGDTPYPHEREAIAFVEEQLPNQSPFLAWELVELLDGSTGRLYEIDLLVLGYSALYLVEIKSGPGVYKGDSIDWYRDVPGEPPHYLECPYRLTNTKAKVLAGLLQRRLRERTPWVQPLIFLSHSDVKLSLRADGLTAVVTRATIKRALTHHEFPNRDPHWRGEPIRDPVVRHLTRAIEESGVRPRKGRMFVGSYELGAILEEGSGYQDRIATHRVTKTIELRARTYLVPQQTSIERRQTLRRAADREAQLLHDLREYAGILRFSHYVEDAPLGPTVLFDPFDGVRLDAFIRQNHDLSLSERVDILRQIGHALAFCHRRGVLHGGLNPEAALVRRAPGGALEVRLFNFQLASTDRVEPTAHISAWTAQPMLVYQAPELREDPTARSPESDIFSLGAVAYFVLTGQAPAADVVALDERLRAQSALDPRAVDDRISADVAEVIKNATNVAWAQRFDNAAEWVELLEEYATAPEPALKPSFADPLHATKGDRLSAALEVIGVLGQGASARVLRVRRLPEDTEYALKVSLSAEHDDRVRAEGRTLEKLRHARIVEKVDELDLSDHACLLLTIAGTMTLQRQLQQQGPAPLDYALRWGEDLLSAVEYLEDEGVAHRDIKPANLGIGSTGKKANHLSLFDFSLAGDSTPLDAGTAAYRDPFLRARGAWDAAADRWSAAVTLHEMLTGARATYGGPHGSSVDPGAKLALAAERFDASIRDRLVRFFEKALARDASARFDSAAAMRRAWTACFAESSAHPEATAARTAALAAPEETTPLPAAPTDDDLRRISPDAPIATLPLSIRAKNALDRAGVVRARHLAKLPANRISAIRGVGAQVVREIHAFGTRWRALQSSSDLETPLFFPFYRGENVPIGSPALSAAAVDALTTAGLGTCALLAGAPADQVATLAKRGAFEVQLLRDVLDREHRAADERDHPSTIEGWCQALLPEKRRKDRPAIAAVVRAMLGLTSPAEGKPLLPIGASASDVAEASGTTPANVYLGLGRARQAWNAHPAGAELLAMVRGLVDASGGALSLVEAAEQLLVRIPYDRARPQDEAVRSAAALVRVAADLDREADAPQVVQARIGDVLWLCASSSHVAALRELASAADALAARMPLASAPETQAALLEVAKETPLAALAADRLAPLAARASATAACSTRFEMYPRGMDPRRAVELTASVLTGDALTPDEVRKRVKDRYPEAAALPDRPELDGLLEPHGLQWTGKSYQRRGEEARTRYSTVHSTFTRLPTALPLEPRQATPEALGAREIDERLVSAVDRKQLRVVLVRSDLVPKALPRLAERFGVPVHRVDRLLIEAMERGATEDEIDATVLHETHEEGARGSDWAHLVDLAAEASDQVAKALLPPREPLLLSHLGLVVRYGLQRFVEAVADASRRDECEAIFLVLPAHDESIAASLEGLRVPGLLPSQVLRLSREWIENRHNAAAPAA
jgi:serine/threonine protein kinase